ncbi:hypothetical protein GOODEAATRI_030701 [Goodea atripinnis]|uniref:Corticotropin-releasing factor domain-containing protein n=1 Tax=Goodea atripinnis TaxID=208336 RepID=A0ABV0P966_9TELE
MINHLPPNPPADSCDVKMKLNIFLWLSALLSIFHPQSDGRPADGPSGHHLLLSQPLLLHLGEELSLQLGGGGRAVDIPSSLEVKRALLQLWAEQQDEEAKKKMKRSDEPPLSLDLTFHLLREVLEMARAEQLAQQADSNRKMMDSFGK